MVIFHQHRSETAPETTQRQTKMHAAQKCQKTKSAEYGSQASFRSPCIGHSKYAPYAHRRGVALSPVCLYHHAKSHLFCRDPEWYGMASLLRHDICLEHFLIHSNDSIINRKLFFLIVLELGAPLSSFLEAALYKSLNE